MTRSAGKRAQSPGSSSERSHILATIRAGREEARADVGGHRVHFTHLDRVYWPAVSELGQPAITKRDFLAYLIAVSPAILPCLRDRPLTLFRWPEGITGRRVLEKHWNIALPSFVERVDVFSNAKGHRDQYILCNNLATLLWLANMGTLEYHGWHSRVRNGSDAPGAGIDFATSGRALEASVLERPDYLLFDIDPFIYAGDEPPGREPSCNAAAFAKAKAVAFALESALSSIGLRALVKTSGKTGLHVIVPILRTLRFDAVREMARVIGTRLVREDPHGVTLEWDIGKRRGKVFVDANMNVRGKSMIAPWSPRGLPGAPVSMPLTWRRLKDANPMEFRIPTAATLWRAEGDPWRDFLGAAQGIEDVLQATSC